MNILIILTGGTIGSVISDGYIHTVTETHPRLLSLYAEYEKQQNTCDHIHFDVTVAYDILSENLDGSHLSILGHVIEQSLSSYDGIIITHGSDTLQFTAAGLLNAFPKPDIPVVLVASNYVLEDARANGFANFATAVSFIKQRLGNGIFVSYQNNVSTEMDPQTGQIKETLNDLAPIYVYRGNTLLPHNAYSDALHGLFGVFYCRFLPEEKNGHLSYDRYELSAVKDRDASSSLLPDDSLFTATNPTGQLDPAADLFSTESGILTLPVLPGMYFPEPDPLLKAILLLSYHSGTLPTDSESFRRFALHAYKMNIPVYVVGADPAATPYESTECYEELHLKLLSPMSPIHAYMTLWSSLK